LWPRWRTISRTNFPNLLIELLIFVGGFLVNSETR
jgi:hypothetical protein